MWEKAQRHRAAPALLAVRLLGLLVVGVLVIAPAHGHGLAAGFVSAPTTKSRWAGARHRRVITASSVQEPPPSVPSRSGEDGSGSASGSNGLLGLSGVLSSLVQQGRAAPLHQQPDGPRQPLRPEEQQQQQERVRASTPQPFSLETAVLLAPFAFEAYNDPPRTEGAYIIFVPLWPNNSSDSISDACIEKSNE